MLDIEIKELIDIIFNNPPKCEKSYFIQFELDNTKELFNTLLEILTKGMIILYGNAENKVELTNLEDNDIILLYKYFASFGVKLYIDVNDYSSKYTGINNNGEDKLSDYFLSLKSKNDEYIISFDLLK